MSNKHNTNGRVLRDLDRMQAQIASGHPRSDHIRADMVALATEVASHGGAGWATLIHLYRLDCQPFADIFGCSAEDVAELAGRN